MGNYCGAETVDTTAEEKVVTAAVFAPAAAAAVAVAETKPAEEAKPAEAQGGLFAGLAAAVTEAVADVQEKVAEVAEAVREKVEEATGAAEAKPEEKKAEAPAAEAAAKVEAAEPVAATMDAATAAAHHSLILEFLQGKEQKKVEFKTKALDFQIGAQAGCCGPKAGARVIVAKVEAKKVAEQLGVKKGWVLTHINGAEVTGVEQGRKLLDEAVAKLPQVAA